MNRKKVAVGISGGVDSAVAALLLKKAGFEVTGVHLYCWPPKSEIEKDGMTREEWIRKNGCRADEDRAFALKTALELEIPFKVLDFSEDYNQKVIKYFYDEYEAGRTPNPDVMCNSEIKFGLFLRWALENGYDYIATGHYAKLEMKNGFSNDHVSLLATDNLPTPAVGNYLDTRREILNDSSKPSISRLRSVAQTDSDLENLRFSLVIPADKHKDQTYFLWKLTQKELSHTLFPLGDLEKREIRQLAEEYKLSVAKRKDSQGICFVGNVEAREFLARRLKENPGKVLDVNGEEIGKHDGVWFYTIGQRGGWEILPKAQKKYVENGVTPVFYVIKKDARANTLVVGEASEATEDHFGVEEVNWINETEEKNLSVRIRHGGELIPARVEKVDGKLKVFLEKKVRGIASGQSAVFMTKKESVWAAG